MKSWQRNDSVFVAVVLVLIAALSVWLYYDFAARVNVGNREKIGTITFKRRVAQRKLDGEVRWETADEKIDLFNRDSIRTADSSEATIELLDGTKIDVDASSMIVLNIDRGKFDINFAYGSIAANSAAGGGTDLTISSEGREIKLNGSEVNLSKGEKDKDLDLVVKKGEASLTTADGKAATLKKDQKAELTGDGVKIEDIRLIPTAPGDNQRFVSAGGATAVNFGWQAVQGGATLQVSTNRAFSNLIVNQQAGATGSGANLNEGVYYWRIAAKNPKTGKTDYSATLRLSVLTSQPLRGLAPAEGASFPSLGQASLVNFAWTRNELISAYTLQIADNPGFGGARAQQSSSNSLSMRLEPGAYYWRVSGRNGLTGDTLTSPTRSFNVTRAEKPGPPAPIQPDNGARVLRAALGGRGLGFNWNPARETTGTRLQIARDAGFGGIVVNEVAAQNFYSLRRELDPGTYFWRLQGESAGGAGDWSEARQFTVIESEKLELLQPTRDQQIDATAAQQGLRFVWKKPSLRGTFRLTLALSPRFDRGTRTATVAGLSHAESLPPGDYFWKVALVEGDRELSVSDVGTFTVSTGPEPPELIYPPKTGIVDMGKRDELTFTWKGSEGAKAYVLRIYNLDGGGRRKVFETETQGTRFALRDLSVLDKGRFAWSLQALGAGGRTTASDEKFNDFVITLGEDLTSPKVTSPEVFFVD